MYFLKCYIDGNLHFETEIEPGKDIIIGRDKECNIQLDSYPGISREHAKIIHLGEKLLVEKMSQAGKLLVDGLSEKSIEIMDNKMFSIPPYNFEIQVERKEESEHDIQAQNKEKPEEVTFAGDFENTSLSTHELVVHIKRIDSENIVEEYDLEGHKWKFGRAITNDVFVDHKKFSREHFQIFKLNDLFYVKDLGSSNGTFLNGHQLPANMEIELKTGDLISVHDYKLLFEIKDKSLEKQIHNLPQIYKADGFKQLGNLTDLHPDSQSLGAKKVKDSLLNPSSWNKKKQIRFGLIALLLVLGIAAALMPQPKPTVSKEQLAAERRKLEEEKLIENAKVAALQYMDQANWSHCLSEVQRIQEIRPEDADANEIGLRCQTAMEKLERQNQLEAQERERELLLQSVQAIINQCRDQVEQGSDIMRSCLQPAIELSPENPEISRLIDLAEEVDRKKMAEEEKRNAYLKRIGAGQSVISTADSYKNKQEWYDAIKWYNKFLKGKFPDPGGKKAIHAKRELASIQSALSSTLKKALEEARLELSKENYRGAVLAARKGLKIDEYHADLKDIELKALSVLRVEIRSLYQDSILMEDLGKIHTAISKWKQIVERDVPGEDYFMKAQRKLKSYETEI